MYIRCKYGILSREIIIHTVIYVVHMRFWPTLHVMGGQGPIMWAFSPFSLGIVAVNWELREFLKWSIECLLALCCTLWVSQCLFFWWYSISLRDGKKNYAGSKTLPASIKEKETRWPEVPWVSPTKGLVLCLSLMHTSSTLAWTFIFYFFTVHGFLL